GGGMRLAWMVSFGALACQTGGEPSEAPVVPRTSTEVVVPSDGLDLEGTFVVPEHRADESVPVVVLVHGSGPNSRDVPVSGQLNLAFGFTFDLFAELSDGLVDEGIAVLRYDKRTCTSANGCRNDYPPPDANVTVDDFLTDAAAAVGFAASQTDIDPDRVFVVGHSQGATLVPPLLRDVPELDGGVLLAGPFRTIDALLRIQLDSSRELLLELGIPEKQADAQLATLSELVGDVEAIAGGTFEGTSTGGGSVAFWESWIDLGIDARDAALATDDVLLVIGGDYDWNVPVEEVDAWEAHLDGSDSYGIATLGCVTHALNCISEPDWQAVTPADIGRGLDPRVVELVAAPMR
ncbi:MAG: alpha/beta fold hydrolase, partial [Myxococcota bacterium]